MAFVFSNQYDQDTEHNLVKFFRTLSEKDRRRFAAIEANKLGHGGITYIAELLGCDRATISSGLEEFNSMDLDADETEGRVRRKGGGRKSVIESDSDVTQNFF